MEIKQLQCFLKVAELLNFSRAAEALYIAQPTLSYQIAELERELGVSLFERDRRKVTLTSAGLKMIEPARNLVEQAEALPDMLRLSDSEEDGLLRIGFDDTEDHFEVTGITAGIAALASAHPGLVLSLATTSFSDCIDRLIEGDMDAAFLIVRNKETMPAELLHKTVYSGEIVAVVHRDCPVQTAEEAFAQMELLLVDQKPRGNSRILRTLRKLKIHPRLRHVDSLASGFVYADMGKGIMLLSKTYFDAHHYPQYKFLPIPTEASHIHHMLVWNKRNDNPMVQRLVEQFQ